MNIRRFVRFCTILASYFCIINTNTVQAQKLVQINELHPDKALFSDLFETVNIIKLETRNDCLLSHISTLKIDENRIFAYDNRMGRLLIFDLNGTFVAKAGEKGKGPGEMILPKDFTLNRELKHIEFQDAYALKIFVFDYDGNFIEARNTINVSDFERINNNTYIGYSSNYPMIYKDKVIDADLISYSNSGELIKEYKGVRNIPRSYRVETFSNLVLSNDNEVFLVPVLENCMFRVDQSLKLEKVYDFRFETKLPKNFLNSGKRLETNSSEKPENRYPAFIRSINVIQNVVSFTFSFKGEIYRCFHNMNTEATTTVKAKEFINDIAGISSHGFRGIFDKGVVDVIGADDFVSEYSLNSQNYKGTLKEEFIEEKKLVSEVVRKTDKNDNPILMFYTYK